MSGSFRPTRTTYRHSKTGVAPFGFGLNSASDAVRIAVLGITVLIFILGVAGVLVSQIFHQYSTLKWALTFCGPLFIILLLIVKRPTAWAAALVIFTVPIAPYVATLGNEPISLLFVSLILASVVAAIEGTTMVIEGGRSSAILAVAPWIAVLLILPTVLGTSVPHEILYLAFFADIVWICRRVAAFYPNGRLVLVLLFLGSAGAQAVFALIQHGTGHQFNLYGGAGTDSYSAENYFFEYGTAARTTGTFFDPISLGNVLAMAFPLSLLVLLREELRKTYRWYAGLIALVLIGGLAVSLSRASWMGAVAGSLCVAACSRGNQRRRLFALSGSLIFAALLVGSVLYGPAIDARFNSIFHPTAATVRTATADKVREDDWRVSLRVFEADPITGIGFGNLAAKLEVLIPGTEAGSHAQNTYIQYLAEGGLFGGAVLVLLIGGVAVDLYRSKDTDWLYPGLVGSFVSIGVTWVTDYTVRYYAVAGCAGILIGLAASSSCQPKETVAIGNVRRPRHAMVK
jgi:O-antigen ligase